jgi:hypothetical protein
MIDNEWLDEIRRRIQTALIQSKREELYEKYDVQAEYVNPLLSPEVENEFLDYILEFEKQFESAETITVRERIGNPTILSLAELPPDKVGEAVEALMDLLLAHGIAVDFLGEVDDIEAYRYLSGELLDEEMDDIRIPGTTVHFDYSTPEYDVEMWVSDFVGNVLFQEREYFLEFLDKQPLFDVDGEPVTADEYRQQIEAVWAELLPVRPGQFAVEPMATVVEGDGATVTAVVRYYDGRYDAIREVESFFRLQVSPYYGWDVVQTSFLDNLLAEN